MREWELYEFDKADLADIEVTAPYIMSADGLSRGFDVNGGL